MVIITGLTPFVLFLFDVVIHVTGQRSNERSQ